MSVKIICLVGGDRVIIPAVPVAEYDFHKFIAFVVAGVVLHMELLTHVFGFLVID